MASIAELFVRIRGDTTDINRKVKGVQDSLDSFGKTATRVLGGLGVGLSFGEFIRNSVEAQNAIAQLNAVVKSTGGAAGFTTPQLGAMAGQLQKVSTFSDEAIMGAQGLLLTFTKIKGDTLKNATQSVLDLATAMGGDLRGAAIQVGKALQDPAQGLTALRRVGVSFSESQQEVIKNLFATGHQAEAQALILNELQKEFGGSALAARNTLGGALTALKNSFGDALEVSSNASTGIVGAINNIADAMPGAKEKADSFFKFLTIGFGELAIATEKADIYMARFQKKFGEILSHIPGLKGAGAAEVGAASAILGRDNGQGALIALEKLRAEWINQANAMGTAATATGHANAGIDDTTTTAAAATKALKDFTDKAEAAVAIFTSLETHGVKSNTVNQTLVDAYDKVAAKLREMGDVASVARQQMLALQDALLGNIVVARHVAAINATGTVGPLVGKTLPGVTVTANGAIKDATGKLVNAPLAHATGADPLVKLPDLTKDSIEQEKRNTQLLRDTIANTASQIASVIGSALLSFGNMSKQAQIGGALGGALGGGIGGYLGNRAGQEIGGVLGAAVGSVIPVVGTLVGGFIGSAIGGLFGHHKKAVDNNTQAVRALTQALLLNAPAGFRVGSYAYAATATGGADVEAYATAARRRAARGGTVPL